MKIVEEEDPSPEPPRFPTQKQGLIDKHHRPDLFPSEANANLSNLNHERADYTLTKQISQQSLTCLSSSVQRIRKCKELILQNHTRWLPLTVASSSMRLIPLQPFTPALQLRTRRADICLRCPTMLTLIKVNRWEVWRLCQKRLAEVRQPEYALVLSQLVEP